MRYSHGSSSETLTSSSCREPTLDQPETSKKSLEILILYNVYSCRGAVQKLDSGHEVRSPEGNPLRSPAEGNERLRG
jgi:hypothetical protein